MSTNSTNYGSQSITYIYKEEARAKYFNRLLSDLIPYGIYSGGTINRTNNYQISIPALTCVIKSNESTDLNISVRVEMQTSQTISLELGTYTGYADPSKPYIVLRFGWSEAENNYMDIKAVAFSDDSEETDENKILPDDLIVGKVLFELSGSHYIIKTSNSFDYTRQSNAFIPDAVLQKNELKVQSSENNARKVYIRSGTVYTSQGMQVVSGGDYPLSGTINDTTSQGRIDLVYVDEDGNVQIELGTPAASPVAPDYKNKKVIAEISRGANRTSVLGPDITQINTGRQGMTSASDFAIIDSGGYYTNNNIENALQEAYEYAASIESDLETTTNNLTAHEVLDANSNEVHGLEINSDMTGTTEVPNTSAIKEHLRTSTVVEWQSDVTYSQNDVVARLGVIYASVQNTNINHDPNTDGGTWWTDLTGTSESRIITDWELGENATAGDIMAAEEGSNTAIIADKGDSTKVDIIGILIESGLNGETKSIQKIGSYTDTGYSFTAGNECYLGDAGAITQDITDIAIGEYIVPLGAAQTTTSIDIAIGKATEQKGAITETDAIITTQAQFNSIIERVAANQYKISDNYRSIHMKYLSGGYQCSGVTSFLSGGDTWGYIETNNCAVLECEVGADFDFNAVAGYIEVNTNDAYLKNVSVIGNGSSGAITQSFLLNAYRVKFDHCNTNTRNSSVSFVGFQGSGTALHNYTSSYDSCSVYTIDSTGATTIHCFDGCHNLNDCVAYDIDFDTGTGIGYYDCHRAINCIIYDIQGTSGILNAYDSCYELSSCRAEQLDLTTGAMIGYTGSHHLSSCVAADLDVTSGTISAYYQCGEMSSCRAEYLTSTGGTISGFEDCAGMAVCKANDIATSSVGAHAAYGFDSCNDMTGCRAQNIDSNAGNAIGFVSCNVLSGCHSREIDANSGNAFGFAASNYLSACYTVDIDSVSGSASGFSTCSYGAALYTNEATNGGNDWIDTVDTQVTNKVSCPSVFT